MNGINFLYLSDACGKIYSEISLNEKLESNLKKRRLKKEIIRGKRHYLQSLLLQQHLSQLLSRKVGFTGVDFSEAGRN